MQWSVLLLIFVIINGCMLKNNSLKKDSKVVVKYYTETLAYDKTWYHYKPQPSYFNEAPSDFNISKPFQCNEPWEGVSEVYFKNKTMYKINIPFKVTEYCSKFLIDESTNEESYIRYVTSKQKYDSQGKLSSIIYPRFKQKLVFNYTKDTKTITTYFLDSSKSEASKYFYDANKSLVKMFKYKNTKQYSIFRFDKKDKNVLLEYDMKGKLTGEVIELYEDPSN